MPHLDIRLLGPPRIELDGQPVTLPRAKATALLALLAVADALGFEAEAFVRSAARVRELATADPFGGRAEGTTHLVVLARSALDAEATRAVEGLSGPADRLVVDGADIHWRIEGKSMDSALTPKDWKATGIGPITNRNTTMLAKLADRLEG